MRHLKVELYGKWENNGQTVQGKAERMAFAWAALGAKYGFDPWTVLPITHFLILAIPKDTNG
jgi:hypothetical protein